MGRAPQIRMPLWHIPSLVTLRAPGRATLAVASMLLTGLGATADRARAADPTPRTAWSTSMGAASLVGGHEVTYRMLIRVGAAGSDLRLRLANRASDRPTRIAAVRIARAADGIGQTAAIEPGTAVQVRFAGADDVTIPPRSDVRSDVVRFPVTAGEFVAISMYVPDAPVATNHPNAVGPGRWGGFQYRTGNGAGDHTQDAAGTSFTVRDSAYYWIDEIQVRGEGPPSVLALGDSLTDGATSVLAVTSDRYGRRDSYPDVLGELLRAARGNDAPAVLNEGVSGDSVRGIEARLEQDVFALSGVGTVILCVGSNDLYMGRQALEIAGGITEVARRIADRGIKVILGTVPPRRLYISTAGEAQRQILNDHIRAGGLPVADFDAVLRDPARTDRLASRFDSGDSAHPSSAGYAAMAQEASRVLATGERRPALAIRRTSLRRALRKGLVVRLSGATAHTTVEMVATADRRRVASSRATTGAAGDARLRLRFTRTARKRFARRSSLRLRIAPSDGLPGKRIRLRR